MCRCSLMVTLIVPFSAALVLDQGCYGMWLRLWGPCNEPQAFDITVSVPIRAVTYETNAGETTFPITEHGDICGASNYRAGGGSQLDLLL